MSDSRLALEAIGRLPDPEIDLADAALQLARIDAPDADWPAARAHLSALARDAAAFAAADDLPTRSDLLVDLIVHQHGYTGDTDTYDDLSNANLIRVIERRRGLPVSLGILALHCARAAGWRAHGVDFPGHFLVALDGGGLHRVIDVFNGGQVLEAPDLRALLKRFEGGDAELRPGMLRPMRAREVLLRLQNNLRLRHLNAGRLDAALVALQDMLRFAPDAATLWREAAVLHERLDQVSAALRCYARFLDLVPDGEVATRVRGAMDQLRGRLN